MDLITSLARTPGSVELAIPGTQQANMAPSEARGELQYMSWVDDDDVPAAHRAFARRHVDRAARKLKLGHVRIRWFGPFVDDGRDSFWGVAPDADLIPAGVTPDNQPMTIALNAGLRGEAVAACIAHEVRHVAQDVALAMLSDIDQRESDADAFAIAYIGRG
jgi:hypothetical protein